MKTSQNFEHLRVKWPELAELTAYAEQYAVTDPQSSMVKLRCYVEKIVGYLYRELRLPVLPTANIYDKLCSASFTAVVDQTLLDKFHSLRKGGNKAAHDGYVNQHDCLWLVKEAYLISCWLYIAYGGGKVEDCGQFVSPENVPNGNESKAEFKRKNKQLQQKLKQNSAELEQALKELEQAQKEQLLAQQEAAKLKLQVNQVSADKLKQNTEKLKSTFDFNE